ncbi:MAG: hypothetical protein DMG86_11700 [Acidobacteria bacterium]|nr:MAG: hypothetical protein AUI85_11615 [Acidobacteriales bacterium 13_1_40CM_3_55_5]PYX00799.1 MAG: hypothetical protein DMG86_11700 [Acidobacteriota bacterium]PYX16379.1 MAG: hypothetical protein DMG84_07775 [Acidobacteriota bacterium]
MLKAAVISAMYLTSAVAFAQDPYANAPAYVKTVAGGGVKVIQPLVTTGQQVPLAGSTSQKYLFVGIPDGMGVYSTNQGSKVGQFKLTVNHELRPTQGVPFGTLPGGARISELSVGYQIKGSTPSLTVNDGKLVFTQVFGPRTDGTYGEIVAPTRGFGRFCSATLGFDAVGFDRPIHLTGEENGAPNNFYGDGSVATATFDGAVHVLPDIGKADWENVVPVPFTNEKTVLILDEDGGALDSQVYMYVGTKDPSSSDPLQKNGLVGGSPGSVNPYGHLYKMQFDPQNPTGTTQLTMLLDGSEGIVSPDNVDVNRHGEIIILEDPNYNLAADLNLTRDTSMWLYDTNTAKLTRVAEMNRSAAVAHALAADPLNTDVASTDIPGGWEFSGVIDMEDLLGRGSWLVNVQAHSLRINPSKSTVEGGQIFYVQVKTDN